MFYTKEELVKELSGRVYTIYVSRLMDMIISYKSQEQIIQCILNDAFKLNIDLNADGWRSLVKRKLETKDIKKSTLDMMFSKTSNPIYNIINKYIAIDKKVKDLNILYNQLGLNHDLEEEISVNKQFKFGINDAGFIQITMPTFSGLTKEEIISITGFWESMEFTSTEQIINWLNKHDNHFESGYSSNFLIKGKILYLTVYGSEQMSKGEKSNGDRF
ncbi:hypothetical protein ACJDT4_09405 [Clostridium neuense]|uniref:DUF2313 domain-containing protein n=1 Tax=Clostridium neuense TaxID=1728934 RepID=A0ABW8TF86_9CLOT